MNRIKNWESNQEGVVVILTNPRGIIVRYSPVKWKLKTTADVKKTLTTQKKKKRFNFKAQAHQKHYDFAKTISYWRKSHVGQLVDKIQKLSKIYLRIFDLKRKSHRKKEDYVVPNLLATLALWKIVVTD